MISVGIAAAFVNLCRAIGWTSIYFFGFTLTACIGYATWFTTRRRPRVARWGFVIAAASGSISTAVRAD
jgi:hypothetical protein